MGDFLDLMCPHTGLISTNKSNFTKVFNVYMVNKGDFENCRVSGKLFYMKWSSKKLNSFVSPDKNTIYFRCDRPDQENKLTLKMQTFSPSPYGFEFDYCTEYFYIGTQLLFILL